MTELRELFNTDLVIRRRLPDGQVEVKVERAKEPSTSFFGEYR